MLGNNDYKIPAELVFVADLTLKGEVLLAMFLEQRFFFLGNIIEQYQRSQLLAVAFVMVCLELTCSCLYAELVTKIRE